MSIHQGTSSAISRRGSLLFEMVIALGIFVAAALTISGVIAQASETVERGRLRAEADDLAASALTLIRVGVISPEAADRLSEHELRGLVAADSLSVGVDTAAEPRFEIGIETEPTSWQSLTKITVSVAAVNDGPSLAHATGLVDLSRIRGGALRELAP